MCPLLTAPHSLTFQLMNGLLWKGRECSAVCSCSNFFWRDSVICSSCFWYVSSVCGELGVQGSIPVSHLSSGPSIHLPSGFRCMGYQPKTGQSAGKCLLMCCLPFAYPYGWYGDPFRFSQPPFQFNLY